GESPQAPSLFRGRTLQRRRHRALCLRPPRAYVRLRPHDFSGDPRLARARGGPAGLCPDGLATRERRGGRMNVRAAVPPGKKPSPVLRAKTKGSRLNRFVNKKHKFALLRQSLPPTPAERVPASAATNESTDSWRSTCPSLSSGAPESSTRLATARYRDTAPSRSSN